MEFPLLTSAVMLVHVYVGKKPYVLILSGKIVYEYNYPSPKLIITVKQLLCSKVFLTERCKKG